ncbi:hypothetical protein OsccyDRAFT_1239 [Leptolyngbyaceae cyanobacterium JSC-12]|nr:hypothetical protein OsccyDRAFT_1239 [Leptolyngbyaceae cyanobacterium JSC-12]
MAELLIIKLLLVTAENRIKVRSTFRENHDKPFKYASLIWYASCSMKAHLPIIKPGSTQKLEVSLTEITDLDMDEV